MDDFEKILSECRNAVERYVNFKISSKADADDILQEVYLSAYQNIDTLKDKTCFRAWIIGIARNKCNDYFRERAKNFEIPLEAMSGSVLVSGRCGIIETSTVQETLELLGNNDKQILYLYYFKELPQSEIAKRLGIPLGTVKSRLHNAKVNFKDKYPYPPRVLKGEKHMKKLPEYMPEYKLEKYDKEPFSIKWEELMGWFLVPKLGEKVSWAMYDYPEKKRTEYTDMEVVGKAEVHGVEGVEIISIEHEPMGFNAIDGSKQAERRFVAQLTDTHSRLLAESHSENGIKKYYTFLDGDIFNNNWGFGEDNCGNETNIEPKGDIIRIGSEIKTADKSFLLDIVGRYIVSINNQTYDTICLMDIETYNPGVASEQFINKNGRTILWRRFNRDDWAFDHYKQKWTEKLPENERITINGETYVHWYDCITDYIL
ncbi:MAG: RNA polymerase sigma factor [Oscillospiraceae bacterium]|nr:RNA polymerase sigma factor [Oscillospiraceae bacterium]